MKVLELEPLKKKKLKLLIIESEFPVDWWVHPPPKEERDLFASLKFVSKEYIQFIEDLIQKQKPQLLLEEKGLRTEDEFLYDNPLVDVCKQHHILHKMVDISDNALGYITVSLEDKRDLYKSIRKEILTQLSNNAKIKDSSYLQQLVQWGEYLQHAYETEENEIRYEIREAWMMMGLLEFAEKDSNSTVTALLICDKDHFEGITKLAEELGVEVTAFNLKKNFTPSENYGSLKEMLSKSVLDISPIKVKKKKKMDSILYFFDTDEYPSPFDINMAYDAGFNIVIPFSKVTAKSVTKLVQDAIFSRGPKAPTSFFVGGSNVKEGEKVAKQVMKALVPPFEAPVIIDPRGSSTTAAALVAKTEGLAMEHDMPDLAGKKVVVLGTGPVGRIAAILAAKLHCNTTIVETWDASSLEITRDLARELTKEAGEGASEIKGEFATTEAHKLELVKDADIIWSVAAAGVQILSKDIVSQLPPTKILIDINAVPPVGIEGLKPKHDNTEIQPGLFGTGALALGQLKYMTESSILKEAAKTKGAKIFDYNVAFQTAQTILLGKNIIVSTQT